MCKEAKTVTMLVVYVDEIVVIKKNEGSKWLSGKGIWSWGSWRLKYLLGPEVARIKKYTLHLLESTGILGADPVGTPIKQNRGLHSGSSELLHVQTSKCISKIGWEVNLSISRLDIIHCKYWVSSYVLHKLDILQQSLGRCILVMFI